MKKLFTIKEENISISDNLRQFMAPQKIYLLRGNDELEINSYIYKNTFYNNGISSVSGKVNKVTKKIINNKAVDVYEILNDFEENIYQKRKKVTVSKLDDLVDVLKQNNLYNISSKFEKVLDVDNLVITSLDSEIYSVKELIRFNNNYVEILDTIDKLMTILNLEESLLVTKDTCFQNIERIKSTIGMYPRISLSLVPDKYLISFNKYLCEYLKLDHQRTLFLSVNEIYDIYTILTKNNGVCETFITISGTALDKSFCVNVKLNTSFEEVFDEYVSLNTEDYEVFINGYLQGYKIDKFKDLIITNDVKCVVFNKKKQKKSTECINCGACIKICPERINVKKNYHKERFSSKCIECGLCNYICPASLPLKETLGSGNNEKL